MSKFAQFKKSCRSTAKSSSSSVAHVALTAKTVLNCRRNGFNQLGLALHVESGRKDSFKEFHGDVTVEVEGLSPVTLRKVDHNMVWLSNQDDEDGIGSLFDVLYTEDFNAKIEELEAIIPEDAEGDALKLLQKVQRTAAKKVRSTIEAKISYDEPQPIED